MTLKNEQLTIAAWFHDTGFTKSIKNHEEESVTIASAFLKMNKNYTETDIKSVCDLILATKIRARAKKFS